jgi:uncharacterized membrane protein YkvA (DUF1232 family)
MQARWRPDRRRVATGGDATSSRARSPARDDASMDKASFDASSAASGYALSMRRLFGLWRFGRNDLRLLVHALRHPSRPVWLWPAATALLIYALDPLNFAMPLFGAVDDFVLLPLLLHAVLSLLPLDIRTSFARSRIPILRTR